MSILLDEAFDVFGVDESDIRNWCICLVITVWYNIHKYNFKFEIYI
jgi:hypothetical protein